MSHTPQVSIIIPAYNCAQYLGETIRSVLNQEFNDLEIIIVNDGSFDNTGEIAKSFGSPVRVIEQDNAGVCAARNRGLAEAKGEFIALMDHDDFWFKNKLSNQVDILNNHPEAAVVFSNFYWWHPQSDGQHIIPADTLALSRTPGFDESFCGWIYHKMLFDSWVLTSTALARKEVFEKCGGFDEKLPYSEDWDFWLRVSRDFQFLKTRQTTTLYRQHHNQGSRVVRDIDYRTILIENAVNKWGYCDRDGNCADRRAVARKLAEYHVDFAMQHVRFGKTNLAFRSFAKGFRADPTYWRGAAYAIASLVGWKPKW
jgi:glycosyltransferase involved in cell wall biosynthesis